MNSFSAGGTVEGTVRSARRTHVESMIRERDEDAIGERRWSGEGQITAMVTCMHQRCPARDEACRLEAYLAQP